MKIYIVLRNHGTERDWQFEGVREWFITSDNKLLHVKEDKRHLVIPFDEITCVVVYT